VRVACARAILLEVTLAFDAYPRTVVDHVLADFDIAHGDRCGAEGVAVVFGTSAPSAWRALVADVIVEAARARATTRTGVRNEAITAIFAGSAFSHVATWQTEAHLERTAREVATLATLYAVRAGIAVTRAERDAMTETIVARLHDGGATQVFSEDVAYTVVSARRSHANRLSAHATARGT
jgi:hypothetical protein